MNNTKLNNVYFSSEQDGKTEREFKNALCTMFIEQHVSVRAYLAQVKYNENNNEFNVALCVMTKEKDSTNTNVFHQIVKIFKSLFGGHEHLDVIFLNHQQEKDIREVCCPFFVSLDYQIATPDFYLISSEGYGLDYPIACFKKKRLYGKHPDGYLLCDIEPALFREDYEGLVKSEQIVLANRHQGYSLFPIQEWPVYVHIAIPLTSHIETKDHISESDIQLIAWGELYQRKSGAIKGNVRSN